MIDLKNPNKKKGALDALNIILVSRTRKIRANDEDENEDGYELKMPKNVEAVSKSDENDQETEEERQERIDRIEQSFEGEEAEADLQDILTDTEIRQGDIERAKEDEKRAAAARGKLLSFDEFEADLFDAIKAQLGEAKTPDETYLRINPTYADSDLLMPGMDYPDVKMKPKIAVFIDQSGSFGPDDIKVAEDAIATLWDFERKGKIETKMWFFANKVHDNPEAARSEGGTRAFPEILKYIKEEDANNVIILTDDDFEGQTNWNICPTIEVRGCVWWLWRYGSRSRSATKHLNGELGNFQYKL